MNRLNCQPTKNPAGRRFAKGLALRACLALVLSLAGLAEARAVQPTDSTDVTRPSSPTSRLERILTVGQVGQVRVVVTAPRGQTVDPRIFEVLELVPTRPVQAGLSQQTPVLPTPSLAGPTPVGSGHPVNVSGYDVQVHLVGTASGGQESAVTATSCQAGFILRYAAGVALNPASAMTLTINGSPEELMAVVYPQGGNVDLAVYEGNTLMGASANASGMLDATGLYNPSCSQTGTLFSAVITNPSSSTPARFVGTVSVFLITP